jgi:hypothetical protein
MSLVVLQSAGWGPRLAHCLAWQWSERLSRLAPDEIPLDPRALLVESEGSQAAPPLGRGVMRVARGDSELGALLLRAGDFEYIFIDGPLGEASVKDLNQAQMFVIAARAPRMSWTAPPGWSGRASGPGRGLSTCTASRIRE